jgi:predicted nucleic acid-binding protein
MRVVLGMNVLVSGLAYPASGPGRIVAAWRASAFDVVVSRFLLDELARTLPRLAHRTGWTPADAADFVDAFAVLADVVEPGESALQAASRAGLRDAADVPILALCLEARPTCLVTGDADLRALAGAYPILSPAEFVARYGL